MAKAAGIYENRSTNSFSVKHDRHIIHFDGYGEPSSLQFLTQEQANFAPILTLIETNVLKMALRHDRLHQIYDKIQTRYDNMNSASTKMYGEIADLVQAIKNLEEDVANYKLTSKRYLAWEHMLEWAYRYLTGN